MEIDDDDESSQSDHNQRFIQQFATTNPNKYVMHLPDLDATA